jgi:hypothetical protein
MTLWQAVLAQLPGIVPMLAPAQTPWRAVDDGLLCLTSLAPLLYDGLEEVCAAVAVAQRSATWTALTAGLEDVAAVVVAQRSATWIALGDAFVVQMVCPTAAPPMASRCCARHPFCCHVPYSAHCRTRDCSWTHWFLRHAHYRREFGWHDACGRPCVFAPVCVWQSVLEARWSAVRRAWVGAVVRALAKVPPRWYR